MGQGAMLAFSVGSTLMSAKMQKDAYEMEAQQNEENAELAKIEMEQQENARRDQLLNVLSTRLSHKVKLIRVDSAIAPAGWVPWIWQQVSLKARAVRILYSPCLSK